MKRSMAGRLLLALLLSTAAPAWAVFKCDSGGQVTYTDLPCDDGKTLDVAPTASADTADASRQVAQERKRLKTLERERHKREAAEQRELKKASSQRAARHRKCAAHARRQRLANEDVARTAGIANEKARRKAQRITEAYEAECGRWYEREMSVAR